MNKLINYSFRHSLCWLLLFLSVNLKGQLNPFTEAYLIDKEDMQMMSDIVNRKPEKLIFPNPSQEAQWYSKAGLGLFMHWGIHSVYAAQPSWEMVPGFPSGGRISPPEKYYDAAKEFNPKNYVPEKFLKASKDAGFNYAVLTAKHHDGFALWPSKYGLSTKQYMGGRDLLKPYVEACRKVGIKVGFYYSPRDWYYPGYPEASVRLKGIAAPTTDKVASHKEFEKFLAFTLRQIKELLTNYGPIDMIWFDGIGWPDEKNMYNEQVYSYIRSLQPGVLINDRWYDATNPLDPDERFSFGDFSTTFECKIPDYKPNGLWEMCDIWTDGPAGWGYDITGAYKQWDFLFKLFITPRSLGGNFLLNVGPNPDGDMDPIFYRKVGELKEWMEKCKESVIGSDPTPGMELSNVMMTSRPGAWYLHILPGFKEPVKVNVTRRPQSVLWMNTGKEISYSYKNGIITLSLPENERSKIDDVVRIVLNIVR